MSHTETVRIAAPGAAPRAGWRIASLGLSMLLSSLGVSIANVALPTLAAAFGAPFQEVQWVVIGYLVALTVAVVGVGRLGDARGFRPVLLAGIAVFTLASLLCGLAPSLWLLVAARALQGAGAAALMALAVALVRETVPAARTGSAMGLLGTLSALGTALGPPLGGVLIATLGWRALFLAMLPLGLLNLALVHRHLPATRPAPGAAPGRFDTAGAALFALALGSYALAMTVGRGAFGLPSLALLGLAALAGGAFLRAEARAAVPLIRLATLARAGLAASLAMNALVATVMMATLVVGPFFLARGLGLDAARVGAVMAAGPVLSILSGVPSGRLVDRLGAALVARAGLALMTAGALALAWLPQRAGVCGYVLAIAILTPGYQLFQAANGTLVMAGAGAGERGTISGLLSLARNLGLITGAAAMGAVFAAAGGAPDTAAPADLARGLGTTFAVAAGLVALALALAIATRPGRSPS